MLCSPHAFSWAEHLLPLSSPCFLILTLNYYPFAHVCHNLSHSTMGRWQILWGSLNLASLLFSRPAIYMTGFFLASAVAETSHGIISSHSRLDMEPASGCDLTLWPLLWSRLSRHICFSIWPQPEVYTFCDMWQEGRGFDPCVAVTSLSFPVAMSVK